MSGQVMWHVRGDRRHGYLLWTAWRRWPNPLTWFAYWAWHRWVLRYTWYDRPSDSWWKL